MKAILPSILAILASLGPLSATVVEKAVEYTSDGVTCQGWQAFDNLTGKRPGILIPMPNGSTLIKDHWKNLAKKLAELGYNVLVVNLNGKDKPYEYRRPAPMSRIKDALETLRKDGRTDVARLAVLGYGNQNGQTAIELARSGADIKAIVCFHSDISSTGPEDGKKIKAGILVLLGADDPYVSAKNIDAFAEEMKANSVKYKIIKYPGAMHNFTIPDNVGENDRSRGTGYDSDADKRAWAQTKAFLSQTLGR
jgi:dienelactone hydrolase